jgi:hypothetical protein
MAADMAAWLWQQFSGGCIVAAVVWQHWGSGGIPVVMVAASVLRGGSIGT